MRLVAGHASSSPIGITSGAYDESHLHDQIATVRAHRDMANIRACRESGGVYANGQMRDALINLSGIHRDRRDIRLDISSQRAATTIADVEIHGRHLIDQEISSV